jgi:hypothetical protein
MYTALPHDRGARELKSTPDRSPTAEIFQSIKRPRTNRGGNPYHRPPDNIRRAHRQISARSKNGDHLSKRASWIWSVLYAFGRHDNVEVVAAKPIDQVHRIANDSFAASQLTCSINQSRTEITCENGRAAFYQPTAEVAKTASDIKHGLAGQDGI